MHWLSRCQKMCVYRTSVKGMQLVDLKERKRTVVDLRHLFLLDPGDFEKLGIRDPKEWSCSIMRSPGRILVGFVNGEIDQRCC